MHKFCKEIVIKLLYLGWICWPSMVFAVGNTSDLGLGQIAQNMLEPVNVFADFIHTACIIIGSAFIFTSIVKYVEHKRSPLMVPLSTVVFLVIAGIILLLLPLLPLITNSGVQSIY